MSIDTVNEGSTCSFNVEFWGISNVPMTPATVRYLIKDITNNRIVVEWTEVTPAHEIQIDIAADDNGIYNDRPTPFRRFEERVLTVQANFDTDTQFAHEFAYRVKNLRGFDS